MAALKPEIIKDAHTLVSLYQTNPAFRERFDMAIARNVDVTYKHRPLKLYFEVLASTNKAKFNEPYKQIRRLVRHDPEGIIKKTLLDITQKDLRDLTFHVRQAEKNINSTDYPEKEIEKINKIEETAKNLTEKQENHSKRLEETDYLNIPKPPEEEKRPILIPTPIIHKRVEEKETPEIKKEERKTEQPAEFMNLPTAEAEVEKAPEEISRPEEKPLETPLPSEEVAPSEKIPSAAPRLRLPTAPPKERLTAGERFIANPAPFTRNIFSKGAISGIARAGSLIAEGSAQTLAKAGVGAAARAGISVVAKLGLSAATGIATGGVGLVVGVLITAVTTFGNQIKSLGKLILQITVALVAAIILMFIWNWGEKMNSLLPPYTVGEAAGLPTATPTVSPTPSVSPTATPTPPTGVVATCPISGGGISCGSNGTNYYACPGGHCSPSYRAANPGLCETYPATAYGMDIAAGAGSAVSIPTVKDPRDNTVKNIECSFVYQEIGMQGQSINQYNCIIEGNPSGDHFYIQFHHLRPFVPPGPYRTGSVAGYVWSGGDHTHVQVGLNGACQGSAISSCVRPEEYLQCR